MDEAGRNKLWENYTKTKSPDIREKLILEYKKEIGRMDDSINERTTDVDSLEKFARERFYFAAPGDDVYIIE